MEQERQEENQKLTKKISPYKIIYPIIIGLAVVSYMLYGHPGFRVYHSDQNTIRRETKLDTIHPNHISLGIHLGSNPFRHRGNQLGNPFRA